MDKNVIVFDEHENEIGTTWLKRARGLVKKGRACFVSENAIRLTSVPEYNMEDDKMSKNRIEPMENIDAANEAAVEMKTAAQASPVNSTEEAAGVAAPENRYTLAYALEQIAAIQKQNEELDGLLREFLDEYIRGREGEQKPEGDRAALAAEAFRDTVKCRETTNQQLLRFYEKMYDDLRSVSAQDILNAKKNMIEKNLDTIGYLGVNEFDVNRVMDMYNAAQDTIRRMG
ncbi:MAG: hypothetical protein LUE29_10105 [Lachnospiraceae bacterium]|nr:hypothetical protein [Lachnospiraceae bacterium]